MNKNVDTLVMSYTNPDLDTYSCALAYAELLNHQQIPSFAGTFGLPIPEVQFMLKYLNQTPLPELNPKDFEQIIVVDCSWPGNLDARLDRTKVIEVVDHRLGTDQSDFPSATWNIELVGAAATLIAEKFNAAQIAPSQTAACWLMAGIISNSLNLLSPLTTSRDKEMLLWLNRYALLPHDFAHTLFAAKSDVSKGNLHRQLYSDVTTPVINGFGVSQLEMVGAQDVVENRLDEILATLDIIKLEHHLTDAFASLIDIETKRTYFVTADKHIQKILSDILKLHFDGPTAFTSKIWLRKQYIPFAEDAYNLNLSESLVMAE